MVTLLETTSDFGDRSAARLLFALRQRSRTLMEVEMRAGVFGVGPAT